MRSRDDYILEIGGKTIRPTAHDSKTSESNGGRPWLAMHWRCCNVYSRVYRNRQGDAYHGHCPKCAKPIHVKVGPGGTSSRFFEAW